MKKTSPLQAPKGLSANVGQASSLTVHEASLPRVSSGPKPRTPDNKRSASPFHAGSKAARLTATLRRVKLFLCDVDGILTDGTVFMGENSEFKQFDIRDGLGLRLLQREGIKVGWISARPSAATTARAEDLKIDFVCQSQGSKVTAVEGILAKTGLGWADVCYMGDDVVDLAVLKRVGLAITVPDAIAEAKAVANYITTAHAGRGAVREVAKLILVAQGQWAKLIREFSA